MSTATTHPMRTVRIEKVTVNIGVGESGDKLQKAEAVLKGIAGQAPTRTKSRIAQRDWGLRPGQEIGVKVTLRYELAEEFLKNAFYVRNNRIDRYSFDPNGNLSFGIADHTDFPNMRYDPDTGVFGMDVSVTFSRPGARIRRRRIRPQRIPKGHRVSKDEAVAYMIEKFAVEVV